MYDRSILETLDYHHSMLADEVRMQSFLRAILKAVKPGDVVLDIGSGTGILAYFACLAGAKRVYAVEQDPLVGLAEKLCQKNGFADRVVFLNEWSDQVQLLEKVDVLITETLGNLGYEEGILGWVIDAKERLLAPGGQIVPQTVELMVVPTESQEAFEFLDVWQEPLFALDYSPVGEVISNNLVWDSLSPKLFLSQPASVVQSDLTMVESTAIVGDCQFTASRDGMVHGLGCWFCSTLFRGISITNGPPFNTPSWVQILLPLKRPFYIKAGEQIHVQIQADNNGANWHWQASTDREEIDANTQSTRFGQLLQEDLHIDPRMMPVRNADGEIDFAILQMMNGSTGIEAIAQQTLEKYPLQFRSFEDALLHVISVSVYYGQRPSRQFNETAKSSNGHPTKIDISEIMQAE